MAAPELPPAGELPAELRAGSENAPIVAIRGRVGRSEIADLCARVESSFARADVSTVIVDVSDVVDPDVTALDALAHLHLTAKRMGRHIKIRHTCRQLEDLAAFAGLHDVLLGCDDEARGP